MPVESMNVSSLRSTRIAPPCSDGRSSTSSSSDSSLMSSSPARRMALPCSIESSSTIDPSPFPDLERLVTSEEVTPLDRDGQALFPK